MVLIHQYPFNREFMGVEDFASLLGRQRWVFFFEDADDSTSSAGNLLRLFPTITEHRSMKYGQMMECRTHSIIITGTLGSAIAG